VVIGYPGGVASAYQDAGDLPRLTEELDQLHREQARLEREAVHLSNRIAVKEALIEDLIAGRMTLLAVAEEFAELNSDDANAAIIRTNYRGENDLERNANNVLSYAEQRVPHPSAKELLMDELNRQYRRIFSRDAACGKRP
jgi:hypothetical protein